MTSAPPPSVWSSRPSEAWNRWDTPPTWGTCRQGWWDLFRHVDVLAIESNYCPVMQENSDRPEFLKRRIMDGSGHLSNQQSAAAVRAIAPKKHVVLLHLSRQCNTPELAAMGHAGAPYELTVAHHEVPTGLVRVA